MEVQPYLQHDPPLGDVFDEALDEPLGIGSPAALGVEEVVPMPYPLAVQVRDGLLG